MSLYDMLGEAKTKKRFESEFLNPDQAGVMSITDVVYVDKMAKTVIIEGEILESHPKKAGAQAQTPGTRVKRIYSLSKQAWAIDDLKTDLIAMIGIDEKTVTPAQVTELFETAVGKRELVGQAVTFSTSLYSTEKRRAAGKPDLTNVVFGEAKGDINSDENVAKRRAALKK